MSVLDKFLMRSGIKACSLLLVDRLLEFRVQPLQFVVLCYHAQEIPQHFSLSEPHHQPPFLMLGGLSHQYWAPRQGGGGHGGGKLAAELPESCFYAILDQVLDVGLTPFAVLSR